PQQQVAPIEGRQEIVRIASQQWEVKVERGQQLRRHQPQQISAGGGAKAGSPGERGLGSARAAHHVGTLQDMDGQAGLSEHSGGDQSVMTSADHDDVIATHVEYYSETFESALCETNTKTGRINGANGAFRGLTQPLIGIPKA